MVWPIPIKKSLHQIPPHEASSSQRIGVAFDLEAEGYESTFSSTVLAKAMRQKTHQVYSRYLAPGSQILDINCGPGSDFSFFLQHRCVVTGLDCSENMLAQASIAHPDVQLFCLDYNHLEQVPGKFDGICSNFGGLNTQPSFLEFSKACHEKLNPGGYLIINVMTKFAILEILSGLLTRTHAFRRFRNGATAKLRVGNDHLTTYFFNPIDLYRTNFSRHFALTKVVGLGVMVPPVKRKTTGFKALTRLDHLVGDFWPFNRLGDHTMLVLKAKISSP